MDTLYILYHRANGGLAVTNDVSPILNIKALEDMGKVKLIEYVRTLSEQAIVSASLACITVERRWPFIRGV
jgi:hypothetical protein